MFKKIPCRRSELNLMYSLTGGQCFRWHKTGDEEWTGVFAHQVWTLSQNDDFLLFRVLGDSQNSCNKTDIVNESIKPKKRAQSRKDNESAQLKRKINEHEGVSSITKSNNVELLRKYFRLDDLSLTDFYKTWSKSDPNFQEASEKFQGVRILAQDPVENLFSFICSTNNNISRISSMVGKLCTLYGNKLMDDGGSSYYDFPTIDALTASTVEEMLRKHAFGYRAKYIYQSACMIQELGGLNWFTKLQHMPYNEAKAELTKLPGIGAKVADCICLMSLNHLEAIPVDTHIFQVATQRYLPHLKSCKTVTTKVYNEIGDHFRALYGDYAGWAHTIIFCADLKMFQEVPSSHTNKSITDKPKAKKRKIPT